MILECLGYSGAVLDDLCPAVPRGVRYFNRVYQARRASGAPCAVVQRDGRAGWNVIVDLISVPDRYQVIAAAHLRSLVYALVESQVMRSGSAGSEGACGHGLPTRRAAQQLGALAVEAYYDNTDAIRHWNDHLVTGECAWPGRSSRAAGPPPFWPRPGG
jgi:hypothetical protein